MNTTQWATVAVVVIGLLMIVTTVGRISRKLAARSMVRSIDMSPPQWFRSMEGKTEAEQIAIYKELSPTEKRERQRTWRFLCSLSTPGWPAVALLAGLAAFGIATATGLLSGDFGTLFLAALLGGVLSALLVGEPTAIKGRYGAALFDSLRTALYDGGTQYRARLARLNSDRNPIVGIDELMVLSRDDALVRVLYLLILREQR